MESLKKYWRNMGLSEKDIAVLSTLEKLGGKARWKQLESELTPHKMAKKKHLVNI